MKITVDAADLAQAVKACKRCVSRRGPLVSQYIHIRADNNRIFVEALNGLILARVTLEGETAEPGDTLLHTDVMMPKKGSVTVEGDLKECTITSENGIITQSINIGDSVYPDTNRHLQQTESCHTLLVDPVLARDIFTAMADAGETQVALSIPENPNNPIHITGKSTRGLLLPQRKLKEG